MQKDTSFRGRRNTPDTLLHTPFKLARLLGASTLALFVAGCGEDGSSVATSAGAGAPVLIASGATPSPAPTPLPTAEPTPTPTPTPSEELSTSATLIAALDASLDDERKAIATYTAIIEKFGEITPFANIVKAEQKHAIAVEGLYTARDLDIPDNSWIGEGVAPETVVDACLAGVAGEIENIAMYDRLLAALDPVDPDVEQVFLALQAASRDHHLPAFRNCAGLS